MLDVLLDVAVELVDLSRSVFEQRVKDDFLDEREEKRERDQFESEGKIVWKKERELTSGVIVCASLSR